MAAIVRLLVLAAFFVAAAAARAEWETAAPAAVDLDGVALAQLAQDIRAGKYANIHGLLVVRHGKIALEAYFQGKDERRGEPIGVVNFNAKTLHDARSVSKTVVGLLFGIAVAENSIDPNTPVLDFFPEYKDLRTPERMAIRLSHVLSMTSGIKWDEGSRGYGDPTNSETAMDAAKDPYRYVLEQPIATAAGTTFEYSGGDTMLLAGIIERLTHRKIDKYAEMLFAPLEIKTFEWIKYPNGTPIAASGLRLLPRDMAKIGQLFLDNGRWLDAQVLREAWMKDAMAPHAVVSARPFGFQKYGYQLWLGTARVGERSVPFAAAVGWGGQRILIVPSMDLVVVLTAGLYGDPKQTDITFEILLDRVLPAVKE